MNSKNGFFQRLAVPVVVLALAVTSPAELNVVATTSDFGAIAREIGGAHVRVFVLAQPGEDVHFVTPKPSYIAKLSRADVVIEGGAELELGWLPPLLQGSRNARLAPGQPGHVSCAVGVALLEVPDTLDRSGGDIHALGNPHYMVDPVNARLAAERIGAAFCAVDPLRAPAYREGQSGFTNRLSAAMVGWEQALEPYRGRRVAAFHNAWPYFANRYGVRIDLFLEPKPGIPPSPAHLATVMATMKAEGIGAIIVEPYQNRRTAETVAAGTGAQLVALSQYPGGVKGTEGGYIELMDHVVQRLAAALKASPAGKEPAP